MEKLDNSDSESVDMDQMELLVERACELMAKPRKQYVKKSEKSENIEESKAPRKTKQKRYYTDAQKALATENLKKAREKSSAIIKMKNNLNNAIKDDKIKEYENKKEELLSKPVKLIAEIIKPKKEVVEVKEEPVKEVPNVPQAKKYFIPSMHHAKKNGYY